MLLFSWFQREGVLIRRWSDFLSVGAETSQTRRYLRCLTIHHLSGLIFLPLTAEAALKPWTDSVFVQFGEKNLVSGQKQTNKINKNLPPAVMEEFWLILFSSFLIKRPVVTFDLYSEEPQKRRGQPRCLCLFPR